MSKIKVIIIEDELIIAEDMKTILMSLQYDVIGIAYNRKTTESLLSKALPDIALIDIQLKNNEDGISIGYEIKNKFHIPIVFITSHSDYKTIDKAKRINPDGYIIKPFTKDDLFTAIEIAIFNNSTNYGNLTPKNESNSDNIIIKDSIFIRKDYMLIKVKFDDLIWIKSDDNYLELYCKESKYLIRSTLKEFIEKLPGDIFLHVHKSYCINIKHITAINYNSAWLGKIEIPIGRSYIESIKKTLNIEL